MNKKPPNTKEMLSLPDGVRNLIDRKLRHLKRDLEATCLNERLLIYSNLSSAIKKAITDGKTGHAFTKVPIDHYRSVLACCMAATKAWPDKAWVAIAPIVESASLTATHRVALKAIIDEHSWAEGDQPFTLKYADLDNFQSLVARESTRYDGNHERALASLARELDTIGTAGKVAIVNAARQARESADIALEEHLLPLTPAAGGNANAPDTKQTRREQKKRKTQKKYSAWQKEYEKLKKQHRDKSLRWCAQRIAKMPIAENAKPEYIRRKLGEKQ